MMSNCIKLALLLIFIFLIKKTKKEVYNLKSQNTPPNNRLLDPFEADLFRLIKKVKFKRENNNFQMKLSRDIKELKSSKYIWVRDDKSRNMYKDEPSKYQEILNKKIMDNYKIDKDNTIDKINKDTCNFASKLHLNDRLGKFQKKDAYILFKDHKPNFINKLQTRLINPSKTELGKISKNIIQNIVTNVREASHSNLWRNSFDTDILQLLSIIVDNTYFTYNRSTYKPITGLSMGSSISGILAIS